jgi:hypothetical protein
MHRSIRFIAVTLILVASFATPSFAALGLQAGAAIDPDMFLIGGRFRSQPLGDTSITMVPSIEFGIGDNVWMFAGNLDGHYDFKTDSQYAPYIGAGLTLNWFDFDGGDGDLEFGGSILGGIQLNEKFFFETKFGLGDVPDWKFILGWGK